MENRRNSILKSQSGQGILEYLLVLFVTVALIFGLMIKFNDAFRGWANNYFGDYLACILETGELPTFGNSGTNTGATCNELFKEFSLAEGRPRELGPGGGGSGSGAGSTSANSGGSSKAQSVSESSSAGGGGGSSRARAYSGGGRSFGSSSFGGPRSEAAGGRAARKEAQIYTGSTGGSLPGWAGYSSTGTSQRVRRENINMGFGMEREAEEKQDRPTRTLASKGSGGPEAKSRLKATPPPKKRTVEEAEEPMGFGDYLRYLIIAAIIIAIVLFFGGQALQMSRSMD